MLLVLLAKTIGLIKWEFVNRRLVKLTFMSNSRRIFLKNTSLLAGSVVLAGATFELGHAQKMDKKLGRTGPNGMRILGSDQRFTVADTPGIYHHSAGVVHTPAGLVCVYRTCDHHLASWSRINMARSTDGGRTWKEHRELSASSFEKDAACWVAPQTNRMPDGRIFTLIDLGKKKTAFDWPMLSDWQKPDRGMSNHLMESRDHGKTWLPIRQIDKVGGEPSYIVGLSNGTLVYSRTDSAPTNLKKNPSMPWGANYYKSTAVFSDDGGKNWNRTVPIFDCPFMGDCEVGIVEYAPGKLMALSRIGDGGSAFGQPSQIAYSDDFGKTWSKPRLAPVYAHRPWLGKLADGRLFVSFRNAAGSTTGTLSTAFKPEDFAGYHPNNFIWNEACCTLESDGLHLRTEEGTAQAVQFILYPMEDDDSACEVETTLAVKTADTHGCLICVGAWLCFQPTRVFVANRPEQGVDLDATQFHTYRIVNENHRLKLFVDGSLQLDVSTEGIFERNVRFGNRKGAKPTEAHQGGSIFKPDGGGFSRNQSHSLWKTFRFQVRNRRDHSVQWNWEARSGKYPDQFRRDNLIMLERNASFVMADNGYSGWTQQPDGTIIVADYTRGEQALPHPVLRSYRIPLERL